MNKIAKIDEVIRDFNIFTYDESLKILMQNISLKDNKTKNLYVVCGANGSGKSTFIANMYKSKKFSKYQYLNADIYAKYVFAHMEDEKEKNIAAMNHTTDIFNKLVEFGESFIYETVLSHPSKVDLISEAIDKGYNVTAIFMKTKNPEINVNRVNTRAIQGGHYVPYDKVVSRWSRSNENAKSLSKKVASYFEIDNTKQPEFSDIVFNYYHLVGKSPAKNSDGEGK